MNFKYKGRLILNREEFPEKNASALQANGGENNMKLLDSFASSVSCGYIYYNKNGSVIKCNGSCAFNCPVSAGSEIIKEKNNSSSSRKDTRNHCAKIHIHAGEQSDKFSGRYIYNCSAGFVFVTCPVFREKQNMQYVTAGPFIPDNSEAPETVSGTVLGVEELVHNCEINEITNELKSYVDSLPVFTPAKISAVSDMLFLCSRSISDGNYNIVAKNKEIYEQQNKIGDYIQEVKTKLIKESQGYISYPYDKEKQLFYAISTNDLASSRKYLNEILGHIFFSSANDLDVIKVRAMELCIMLSRASLDAGADQTKIFDINLKFLSEFFNYSTLEEVCWALTDILKKFTKETFEFNNVKNVDLISRAVSYIKANYMKKITLNEVAAYVFLSPSYFSKIFKQEMKYYFNDYLNYTRVEKSKILLLTEQLSLVDIADNVGFYDQSYFNKVFKKITGVTPKKYKESNGKLVAKAKMEEKNKNI